MILKVLSLKILSTYQLLDSHVRMKSPPKTKDSFYIIILITFPFKLLQNSK